MNILQNTSTKYKTWRIWENMFYAGLIAFSVGFAYALLSWFLVKEGPCIPMVVAFSVVALLGVVLFAVAGMQLLRHRKVYAKAKTPKKVKPKAKEQELQKVEAAEAVQEKVKKPKPMTSLIKIPAFLTGLLTRLTSLAGKIKFKKKTGEKKETAQTQESVEIKEATEVKIGEQEEEALQQAISDEEIAESIEAADEKGKKNQKKQKGKTEDTPGSDELKLADDNDDNKKSK